MKTYDKNNISIIGERTRKIWKNAAKFWVVVSHSINILAFGSSIFVILLEYYLDDKGTNKMGWIVFQAAMAAILTFVGCALNCRNQFMRYRKAFNVLNVAMLEYYAHSDDETKLDNIVKAIERGENIIDASYDVETTGRDIEKEQDD